VNLLTAALLGVVQGITEFLPVSSSAHLILARAFFGWDAEGFGVAFDVACHVGTLLAVFAFFRSDIAAMVRALPSALSSSASPDGRRIRLIVVGTIPIVIVGLLWSDWLEAPTVRTPLVAAIALLAGAGLLFFIERVGRHGRGEEALSAPGAFIVGIAQASALIPGVSRSGATIAAGMALGLRREVAARFTFLMSIPAILAAAAKKALELRDAPLAPGEAMLFAVGMATSAIVGYLTVKYFVRFLATHRLDVFAWYRVALALVTFVWLARQ
jgi:undecaprenyl-diphosphatase